MLAMSGCAAVSKSECKSGDWYDIGMRDGAQGYGEERFLENAKACAKHGLSSDRERWLDGRMHGLERYCTPRNAFEVGANKSKYGGVCTQFGEDRFLQAYNLGRDLAEARSRFAHWNSEIHDLQDRLDQDDKKDKDSSADKNDNKSDESSERLSKSERVELGIRIGIAIVKREDARRDVADLEARGREL